MQNVTYNNSLEIQGKYFADFLFKKKARAKFHNLKIRCKRKNLGIKISSKDFIEWFFIQEDACEYCERKLNRFLLQIDRKIAGVEYSIDNIVLACSTCNRVKNNIFTYKEFKEIAKTYSLNKR